MKKNNNLDRIVYSTNPDFKFEDEAKNDESIAASQQKLYVSIERLKGGKFATLIENFQGADSALQALGKYLKQKCGTGGTVKDGLILIQGEQREKIMNLLREEGYQVKRKGG